jgi:hypothetical protein
VAKVRADRTGGLIVRKIAASALLVLTLAGGSTAALADDDFPIVGTYLQNQTCKGDGSDRTDLRVKITRKAIESNMTSCAILHVKRDGKSIAAHLECKIPGGQLILGDITLTLRDDSTLDFEDQDHTSSAVLYKCAE